MHIEKREAGLAAKEEELAIRRAARLSGSVKNVCRNWNESQV